MSRYRLQEAFEPLGPESTLQLAKSHVVVIGCGATGSHVTDTLARMGVGKMKVIDPDIIEGENLHRQLYNESDVEQSKAITLANHVRAINSDVTILAIGDRVTADNIHDHVGKPDLILDCTDNMEIRWIINEYSVKHGIPWIYCGVSRAKGMSMAIVPGETACLRCLWSPNEKQDKPSGGIFPPAVAIMANLQAAKAVKILTGNIDHRTTMMHHFDVWSLESASYPTQSKPDCPVCGKVTA